MLRPGQSEAYTYLPSALCQAQSQHRLNLISHPNIIPPKHGTSRFRASMEVRSAQR